MRSLGRKFVPLFVTLRAVLVLLGINYLTMFLFASLSRLLVFNDYVRFILIILINLVLLCFEVNFCIKNNLLPKKLIWPVFILIIGITFSYYGFAFLLTDSWITN